MRVRFPGGWVDVPGGAISRERALHVRTASPMSSTSAARLMHSLAAGITVSLSGLQPQRPLSIALPVPKSLPAGVRPQVLFVAAVESPGDAPHLLATRYDGTDHKLVAQASHLSSFYPVWLDGQAVVRWLASTMVQVLQVRVPRPACAGQPVVLADGSTLKFTSGPWSTGSDPLLWGCLAASDSEPGHIAASLTDNRPMGYSVQIAPGASVNRDPPTLDSSTARLLFDIASAGHARGLELLTAASTIRISVPAGGLPSAGPPVTVAAVRTNMAVVAASAAQSAFLMLESLLQVIAAPEAAALSTALDASGNIDCITATVTTPGPVGFDQVLGGTQLGLRCLGSVLKGRATGIALTVLAAVTSFIATFTGALNLVLSQLTGTDTFTISLQRSPAPAIPTGQTYWTNGTYTVACPGLASEPFSVTMHNGVGHGAPQNDASAGFDVGAGGANAFAVGDLTGDGRPEVAIVIGCHPSQTSPGNATNEVQIFAAGPAGPKMLARLTPPFPDSPFPPVFGGLNPVFQIRERTLVTSVQAWAPGDCHACASINRTTSWRWNGQVFMPSTS
jgi:hypothetical protein